MEPLRHPDPLLQRVIEVYEASRYSFDPAWLTAPKEDGGLVASVRAELRTASMQRGVKELVQMLPDIIATRERERLREAVDVADELAATILKVCGADPLGLGTLTKAKRVDAGTKVADVVAVVSDLARFYEFLRYARTSHQPDDEPVREDVLRWSGLTPWRASVTLG